MSAKVTLPNKLLHSLPHITRRTKWAFVLLALLAAGVVAARTISSSHAASSDPMAPALKLAQGTLKLEDTDQAINAESAAKLLPLWQLLQGLSTSGSAAPEEINAVVEEIRLNMTSAQIEAIDSMKFAADSAAAAPAGFSTSSGSASQAASPASGPMLGDLTGGEAPPDAALMQASGSQSGASPSSTSGATGSPVIIRHVIELLKGKLQS